ncbi:hypothetical protein MASR2M15_06280 [Anaerolineales bacterium]
MENLTLDQIKSLAQQTQSPSISIFLPTHRSGPEIQQDPIRLKNLLRKAEQQFLDSGMGPRDVTALLKPAQSLLEQVNFWQHQREGLAIFLATDDFHYYHLPFSVEEQLIIARSYYLKPVLPMFTNNGHYYLLTISQDEVGLFEATRYSIGQIELPEGTPQSLDEVHKLDDPQTHLQSHTATTHSGMQSAIFHGQGGGEDEQKLRIKRFLNLVDTGLHQILNQSQAPLVLAGVDYLLPIYHEVSKYPNIMPEGISGNPEHLQAKELQERSWKIVEPYFRQGMEEVIDEYHQLTATNQSTDAIEAIVSAAFYGRVDKLLLAVDTPKVWGSFDADTGEVSHYQSEQSLEDDLAVLDFAAMQTLRNDGKVYALSQEEMPTDSPIAAVLRY